jgi:hypothetical protein
MPFLRQILKIYLVSVTSHKPLTGLMDEMKNMGIEAIGGPSHADKKVDFSAPDLKMEVDPEVSPRPQDEHLACMHSVIQIAKLLFIPF